MWPFASTSTSTSGSGGAGNGVGPTPAGADLKLDPHSLEVPQGADGIAKDVPVITYTEQVIAEKEASLRKYIQDNYAKLHAVERELEALRMEVKLTSGSKKAALELLRQKIEESSEKIKAARAREQQAKQAWEAASKALEQEEDHKQRLCEDLRTMIQESAMQQYERLEGLTRKLDALNPELRGVAMSAIEGLRAQIAPHGPPIVNGAAEASTAATQREAGEGDTAQTQGHSDARAQDHSTQERATPLQGASLPDSGATRTAAGAGAEGPEERQHGGLGTEAPESKPSGGDGLTGSRERGGVQLKGQTGRSRGGLVVPKGQRPAGGRGQGGWTGAGFDVDNLS